ncbi:superoxide dismutase family protein [Paenibacillus sp. DMB20]|uniref:superoxide dismutase family protein n=1 Tax=Paenibacillus sp. DMB20 TaxID=1642570 RepID=UPI001F2F6F7B|nr:superoxide dismutase family protein [Paenibacillus sp. DMB20]
MAGALLFSGFSFAAANGEKKPKESQNGSQGVHFYVDGMDHSDQDGSYSNQGLKVPDSIVRNGTTYVPVRMIADLIGKPVFWDGESRSLSIGKPYVPLYNDSGQMTGFAQLEQVEDGVVVKIKATGLSPGKHGFHVHEKAFQSFDFKSAGGHFNPTDKHHGLDNPLGSHVGDMPNLNVEKDGTAEAEFVIAHASLEKNQPNSLLGRSLIIHEGEDDGISDPAGNSGDRVMGGQYPEITKNLS